MSREALADAVPIVIGLIGGSMFVLCAILGLAGVFP